tara:strand:- start:673 stop:882 length:210 start_codon:yes stop_codon:yes gene_type:complete
MKVNKLILLMVIALSTPIQASHDYNLLVKACKDCSWIAYPEVFKLRENCEIARQGIFMAGMTRCARIDE